MSTIDLSRLITDHRKHYAGVRHQQGRVLTDDDVNEAAIIEAEELRRTRLHAIGPYGAPGDGFLPSGFTVSGGRLDFTLTPGELYLGGLRLQMLSAERFLEQRDWLNFDPATAPAPPAAGSSRTDLVWIEAWQQPVTATEDDELHEVALGGPDTATRWRTMRRVHMLPGVAGTTCPDAWATAVAGCAAMGTLGADMQMVTTATLSVTFAAAGNPADLCAPPAAGGYLGAENQAIRVQMVDAAHYTWGFDNAAPLYRATVTLKGGQLVLVTLPTPPRDAAHWPLKDQVVEILSWSAALANGETVAELSGHLCKVATSYDPDQQTFDIDVPLPPGFENWKGRSDAASLPSGHVYVRVWNRGDDLASPARIPIANGALGTTGLSISFAGAPLRPQDHWIIAARPAAPDKVLPWRLALPSGAPPAGVARYRAPLGLIRWTTSAAGAVTAELIDDCRPPFLPLTRLRGCCQVTVGDNVESHGMFSSINAAIAALPPSGGTVCVLPGTYREAVAISNRNNISLHGCGPRSRIVAPDGDGAGSSAVTITDSTDIAVESLALEGGKQAVVRVTGSQVVRVAQCLVQYRDTRGDFSPWAALFAEGEDIEIDGNVIEPLPATPDRLLSRLAAPERALEALAARGGIQLAGGTERARISDNVIVGGLGNGITLGSILRIDDSNPGGTEVVDIDINDPCTPCAPNDHGVDDEDEDGGRIRYESAGDVHDIEIVGNVITRHGGNGISVVRFFAPKDSGMVLVVINGLAITGNRITRCLRRSIETPDAQMLLFLGYGGIALALATDLAISGNHIAHNGVDWRDPVCGVFVLAADGLVIEHNIIRDNGPPADQPASAARPGVRAGIHVWLALSLSRNGGTASVGNAGNSGRAHGIDQIRVHANEVTQPLGRALFLLGAGPMLVTDNRFASEALSETATDSFARCVAIVNLGFSREWTGYLVYAFVLRLLELFGVAGLDSYACLLARLGGFEEGIELPLPTGKTAFHANQVSFHMPEPDRGFDLASVLLLGLDDIGANDNQFEYHIPTERRRFALADVVAAGFTVRTSDNRFAETWGRAFFSLLSLGLLNTAADNQSTHCLKVLGLKTGDSNNLVLGELFCPEFCSGGDDDLMPDLTTGAGLVARPSP
jgi:hypothetical protein